ncbi:hypothetical protein TNIN_442181 [Trichonephila inaurata madagascariensis]|uniref:Uncharacterized protein n=1 Tax=Trichonephila inaurata madagascariensis TaxID=2747483 RepID=A0A8X6XHB1_9ARAC|nr:hypothetical protein TNIN_442181 [Trichonephila inaurata madagascariensis]
MHYHIEAMLAVNKFTNSILYRSNAQGTFSTGGGSAKGGIVSTEDEAERTVGEDNLCVSGNRMMLPSLIILPNENEGVLCLPPFRGGPCEEETPDLYRQCQKGRTKCQRHLPPRMTPGGEKTYCTQMIAHHADSNVGGHDAFWHRSRCWAINHAWITVKIGV